MAENGKVVVTGCLGVHENLIREIHPGVLAVTGPHQYESVMTAVHQALPPAHDPYVDLLPPEGIKLTPRHYAYLKISEGCNNKCTFCIIPSLRGPLTSRPISDVLKEAEGLAEAGVKELLVISQDTSAYGIDTKFPREEWRGKEYRTRFLDLCQGLAELGFQAFEELGRALAQRLVFAHQGIAGQHAAQARVALGEHQYQVHQLLQTHTNVFLLLQHHLATREHGVLGKFNEGFEHFAFAGEVPVQGRLGDTHGFGQASSCDPGPGVFLQQFNKGLQDCVPPAGFLSGHIRTTALCFFATESTKGHGKMKR